MSYGDQLRDIANKYYAEAKEHKPATAKEIAAWAIRNKLWFPRPSDLIEQCAEEIAQAMCQEHFKDGRGRSIRAKHVVRKKMPNGQTRFEWDDSRTAPREWLEVSFQQRRHTIAGECRQLKNDVDWFNDHRAKGDLIQVVFDFTRDLEDWEQQGVA
jgi:hypothetical protein